MLWGSCEAEVHVAMCPASLKGSTGGIAECAERVCCTAKLAAELLELGIGCLCQAQVCAESAHHLSPRSWQAGYHG